MIDPTYREQENRAGAKNYQTKHARFVTTPPTKQPPRGCGENYRTEQMGEAADGFGKPGYGDGVSHVVGALRRPVRPRLLGLLFRLCNGRSCLAEGFFGLGNDVFGGETELGVDLVKRGRCAEAGHADKVAVRAEVTIPTLADACLDTDASGDGWR